MDHFQFAAVGGKTDPWINHPFPMHDPVHAAVNGHRNPDPALHVARKMIVEQRRFRIGGTRIHRIHRDLVDGQFAPRRFSRRPAPGADLALELRRFARERRLREVVDQHRRTGAPGFRAKRGVGGIKIDCAKTLLPLPVRRAVNGTRHRRERDTALGRVAGRGEDRAAAADGFADLRPRRHRQRQHDPSRQNQPLPVIAPHQVHAFTLFVMSTYEVADDSA